MTKEQQELKRQLEKMAEGYEITLAQEREKPDEERNDLYVRRLEEYIRKLKARIRHLD